MTSLAPTGAVLIELARSAGALCLAPARALGYLAARRKLEAELRDDLAREAAPPLEPSIDGLPDRPLSIFVSCAEPSGELHARNLVLELRARARRLGAPEPRFAGLGGSGLESAGVELVGRPVERAAMGITGVVGLLPYYLGLVRGAARSMREDPPDVFVPIDSPALHVPLARIAHRYGIPVVHFVTPQYWGWAPWRVHGYRAAVDRALTILPFEPHWFARRGVRAVHVGHPIRDSWSGDGRAARSAPATGDLVLLPGSRERVIDLNLPWMLALAARLRLEHQDASVVVAHEHARLRARIEEHLRAAGALGWARADVGDLAGSLARARAALSVSGTVLLELLHHRLPAVVIYRLASRHEAWMSRHLLTVPWFSSVNLLAGREVYPEFCFAGDGAHEEVLAALRRAWSDEAWRARCREGLETADRRLGPPGAVGRAAAHALEVALGRAG